MRFYCFFILLIISFFVSAKEIQTHSKVCANPNAACTEQAVYSFQPNEFSFNLPKQLEWQSGYYSAEFYAVILRSIPILQQYNPADDTPCLGFIDEAERLSVQAKFPDNKVFTSRNGCPAMVFYTGTNEQYNFIAVYAGDSKPEALKMLEQVKQAGFPDANLRKMQVIVDNGD